MKGKLANGVGSQYSHTISERGVSSITNADAHTSAANSRLNWLPRRFNGLVRLGERRNVVSARVPSGSARALVQVDWTGLLAECNSSIAPLVLVNRSYTKCESTGVLISLMPDQEGNKLQRQKIFMFIYLFIIRIGGILVLFIYIYITRLAPNEIFSPSNKIHRSRSG